MGCEGASLGAWLGGRRLQLPATLDRSPPSRPLVLGLPVCRMGELASEVGKGLMGDPLPALSEACQWCLRETPRVPSSLWVGSLALCLRLWSFLSSVPLGPFCLLLVPFVAPALCFLLLRGPAGQHSRRADPLTLSVTRPTVSS